MQLPLSDLRSPDQLRRALEESASKLEEAKRELVQYRRIRDLCIQLATEVLAIASDDALLAIKASDDKHKRRKNK